MPDTFHEINGVAHTSRQLQAFARRQQIPFLMIYCGAETMAWQDGAVRILQLKRGPLSFGLDANLQCDPFLLRYAGRVARTIREFGADMVHITGPGDMGWLGVYVAWRLKLPLVISWHTSLHEYAERRVERMLRFAGSRVSAAIARRVGKLSLRILHWFYRQGCLLFAPNGEIVQSLREATHRPVELMSRGVETDLFSPQKRNRYDAPFRIGYVGRLTAEKNVRLFQQIGQALVQAGESSFEFYLVGQGSEDAWLREHVPHVVLPGVLRGEQLAEAYANMDLFVFPSRTDTFGNVVLEALSSGVPCAVMDAGGPKFLIQEGVTGFIASSDNDLVSLVVGAVRNRQTALSMSSAARSFASQQSWDSVFGSVFDGYERCT